MSYIPRSLHVPCSLKRLPFAFGSSDHDRYVLPPALLALAVCHQPERGTFSLLVEVEIDPATSDEHVHFSRAGSILKYSCRGGEQLRAVPPPQCLQSPKHAQVRRSPTFHWHDRRRDARPYPPACSPRAVDHFQK